ncbi:MAG: VWA domain-containing protein [Hyphomicrobium sp.]|jgi:Flp pilus assembly protein TadG
MSDESGSVLIPFSLIAVVLIACIGGGVDIGRWLHARSKTVAAMDAAVIAGARVLQLDSSNVTGAVEAANRFYIENTKGSLSLVDDTVTFAPNADHTSLRSSGNAYIPTPLLNVIGIPKLSLLRENSADYIEAKLATGGNSDTSTEIAVMLDVTGSMAGQKATDMKAAATDLVDIVVSETGANSVKVALVPFSNSVRLPSSAVTAARGTPTAKKKVSGKMYHLTDCVVERTGSQRYTDAAPGASTYVMSLYDRNTYCPLGTSEEVVPLTTSKTTLKAKIAALTVEGGTAGHIGTAWAWYMISPEWNSLWPSNRAAAYGTKVQKIAILMTDGEYNTEYDTNGISTDELRNNPANDISRNQATALCAAMKAKGIIVYTVGFDLEGNQAAASTLSTCATDSTKYYNAKDGAGLKQAFRDIALKLSTLYLSK